MSVNEQLWFLIGIGGFLLFLEGSVTSIVETIARALKRNISVGIVKVIVGLVIFILALVYLFNLP